MSYSMDRGDTDRNEIYTAERDEHRTAVNEYNEQQRFLACMHSRRVKGTCPHCGDQEYP